MSGRPPGLVALVFGAFLLWTGAANLGGGAARGATLTIAITDVEARPSSAAITWQTSAPALVVAEVGLDANYGVWSSRPGSPGTSGVTRLGGLEPRTTYLFHLVARAGATSIDAHGSFVTAPIAAWTTATTTANALFLDWQPFFPRMVWRQCPWAFGSSLAAGINLFMGSGCGDGWTQLAALDGRAFSVLGLGDRGGVDGRGLVGWHQPDEADEHVPADGLPQLPPSKQSHRVTFLTLSNHFFSGAAPLPQGRSMYPALIARAEMVGFDLYPLQIWCRKVALATTYQAQRELAVLAAGKPTYQWIEAAPMTQCGGLDPSAATVRAETWLAVAGGARGIGYFPDNWQPSVAQEIGRIDREIAALAPALLAPAVPVQADASGAVKVGARRYDGATYVIAVNSSFSHARGSFTVDGVGSATARVFGEGRSVPVVNGTIVDWFRGLAVHVYVVPPAPR